MKKYLIGFIFGVGVSVLPAGVTLDSFALNQLVSYSMSRGMSVGIAMTLLEHYDDPEFVCNGIRRMDIAFKPPLKLIDEAAREQVKAAVRKSREYMFKTKDFSCLLSD